MGTIKERKSSKGKAVYYAEVRRRGHRPTYKSFVSHTASVVERMNKKNLRVTEAIESSM